MYTCLIWGSHRALQASQGQVLPPAVREQLSGAVVLPSLFLRDTIPSFQVRHAQICPSYRNPSQWKLCSNIPSAFELTPSLSNR